MNLNFAGYSKACADTSPCIIGPWEPFRDLFYLWQENALSWNAAEELCVCCQGHLASVTSIQVQDFLAEKVTKSGSAIWIGASDEDAEGDWNWRDGSPVVFSQWYVEKIGCCERHHKSVIEQCIDIIIKLCGRKRTTNIIDTGTEGPSKRMSPTTTTCLRLQQIAPNWRLIIIGAKLLVSIIFSPMMISCQLGAICWSLKHVVVVGIVLFERPSEPVA